MRRAHLLLSLLIAFSLVACVPPTELQVEEGSYEAELASSAVSLSKSPAPVPPNLVGDWTGELSARVPWEIALTVSSQSGRTASGVLDLGEDFEEVFGVSTFNVSLTAAASGQLTGVATPGGNSLRRIGPMSLQISGMWGGPTSSPDFDGTLHIEVNSMRRNGPTNGLRRINPNGIRVPNTSLIYPIAMEKG
ncbi:MAG: hypothetical protein KDA24_03965 [Deltaproteobacteria bacterium]|nr:hypothetical protein [Deltaproteobacteria bacterium]